MNPNRSLKRVILLTLTTVMLTSTLSSCAFLGGHLGESCNTRAWVRMDLEASIHQRVNVQSPVRLGVLPFISPANLATRDDERPGLGTQIAWAVQRELLASDTFPIVQMLAREDWPGRKEEFFAGNFGSLAFARDAGFDLIMIGYLEQADRLDTWVVHTKLLEVSSGVTLWYGTSTIRNNQPDMLEISSTAGLTDRRPDIYNTRQMKDSVASCIVHDMLTDPEIDEG